MYSCSSGNCIRFQVNDDDELNIEGSIDHKQLPGAHTSQSRQLSCNSTQQPTLTGAGAAVLQHVQHKNVQQIERPSSPASKRLLLLPPPVAAAQPHRLLLLQRRLRCLLLWLLLQLLLPAASAAPVAPCWLRWRWWRQ